MVAAASLSWIRNPPSAAMALRMIETAKAAWNAFTAPCEIAAGSVSPGFHVFERPRTHLGVYCVWELGAVWHEQGAYKRFLYSDRGDEALQVYLEDQDLGTV